MSRKKIVDQKTTQDICDQDSPRLLTLRDAAERLGLTLWAMRERIWSGQIPVVRFPKGRKIYIDTKDLEELIAQNKDTLT